MSSFEQQKQQRNQQQGGVEELANRLNQMNVYSQQTSNNNNNNLIDEQQQQQIYCGNNNPYRLAGSDLTNIQQNTYDLHQGEENMDMDTNSTTTSLFVAQENQEQQERQQQQQQQHQQQQQQQQQSNNQNKTGYILIVTNVDSSVFSDKLTQTKFESLFLAYDNQVTFRYLKSFRRVRLDFTDSYRAEEARKNLSTFKIGDTICKCFMAQMITPQFQSQQQQDNNETTNYGNNLNECYLSSTNHLNIPKLTKQFLISPPASPPVGWEPVHEGSPCIDVQLLSAMANLVPGKVHEIHPGNESQPGIYVEVCEDPQFPNSQLGGATTKRCHIPKTPLPLK